MRGSNHLWNRGFQIPVCRNNDASILHVCKWRTASKMYVCFSPKCPKKPVFYGNASKLIVTLRKSPTRKRRTFSTKSTLSGGWNRLRRWNCPSGSEIRLDGGWVDFISLCGETAKFHIGEAVISHFAVRQNISLSRIFSVSLDLFTQKWYLISVSGQPRRLHLDPRDACRLCQQGENDQSSVERNIEEWNGLYSENTVPKDVMAGCRTFPFGKQDRLWKSCDLRSWE